MFVNTPPDGVRDLYVGAFYNTRPWPGAQPVALTFVVHDFTDDSGGADFGNELDASARFTLTPHVAVELAAAAFDGREARFADRNKLWVSLEYKLEANYYGLAQSGAVRLLPLHSALGAGDRLGASL